MKFGGAIFEPLAEALSPKTVVLTQGGSDPPSEEIPAWCAKSGATLHLVARITDIDLTLTSNRLGPHLVVHRDLPLNALHRIAEPDLVIRERDYNWWCLRSELDLLHAASGKLGARFPAVCVHGTGWPYARRDQYEDPAAVPTQYRQPYRRAGLSPSFGEPLAEGGYFADAANAVFERKSQSGVLTAIEEFLAAHEGVYAFSQSPAFHGFGLLYRISDFAADHPLPLLARTLAGQGLNAALLSKLEEGRLRTGLELLSLRAGKVAQGQELRALEAELDAARLRELELIQSLEIVRSVRDIVKSARAGTKPRTDTASAPAPKSAEKDRSGNSATFGEVDYYSFEVRRAAELPAILDKRHRGQNLTMVEKEMLVDRFVPLFDRRPKIRSTPGRNVAFVTVANDKFVPGLEAMLLSMLRVYPDFACDVHVCHDGTLTPYLRERLRRLYANLIFVEPDMSWFDLTSTAPGNHKRVGKLGYMNIHGLTLRGYDRVVLLDSDVLVLDDISPLWTGEEILVCYDCGDREYVPRSEYTGEWVLNSGVISLPASALTDENVEEMKNVVRGCIEPVCSILDRFADQKAWNIFLSGKRKRFLPINYNCNIKYAVKHCNGSYDGAAILHFAGPKPWNHSDFLHKSLVSEDSSRAAVHPRPWINSYKRLVGDWRLQQFTELSKKRRATPVRENSVHDGRKICVMMGNGPSLKNTDLSLVANYERFAFNWFVLHKDFDEIAPEHLVLASHQFFGGWNTPNPEFPPNFLTELYAKRHRPVLWTSFIYRELIELQGIERDFEVNYFLFEKPFKYFTDKVGRYDSDIAGFLNDSRSGVLTAGVPAAVSMGFETVLLVGCDANYNQQAANYFYDESKHTSLQTNEASLTSTWSGEGRGQFAYKLMFEHLRDSGVELWDCTLNGKIATVPKRDLTEFSARAAKTESRVEPHGAGRLNGHYRTGQDDASPIGAP